MFEETERERERGTYINYPVGGAAKGGEARST